MSYIPYPDIQDKKFLDKLNQKYEFIRNSTDTDTNQTQEEACNQELFKLFKHQRALKNFFNPLTPYRSLLLVNELGTGKCHAIDTPILMYDGQIKKVQDIKIGEQIMGDNSTPRIVQSLARGKDIMYKIIPIKGESFIVNSEHILCLKLSNRGIHYVKRYTKKKYCVSWINQKTYKLQQKYYNTREECEKYYLNQKEEDNIIEISVKDYLKLSKAAKSSLKLYRKGVDFPFRPTNIEPYLLGLWLGDGGCRDPIITTQDSEIYKYLINTITRMGLVLNYLSGYSYRISSLTGAPGDNTFVNELKSLNLKNNKHIPDIYKINSREIRLQVLAGLLDTDGHYESGHFEITQKNERLADDILFLTRSLGFAAYKKEKKTSWTYQGIKKYGKAFRIHISGHLDEIPTKIKRKQATSRQQIKDVLVTGFNIEELAEDDYYGFTLDKNQRYLMGDFTTTHNSCSSITIAENHKQEILSNGQKIIVLLEDGVKENYINELYNDSKDDNQCIGDTYKAENKRQIMQKINRIYDIITIGTFVNWINKMTKVKDGFDKIKQKFSNTLIIVDEVHNIREREDEDPLLKRYDAFALALSLAEDSKVLLMSATPMFDSATEIVSLLNLFKLNERKSSKNFTKDLIKVEDVFDSKETLTKSGESIIRKELMGRVSYVGQNPTTFPEVKFADQAKTLNFLKKLKVISCPMSERHYENYQKLLDQPITNIRQISNIVANYDQKELKLKTLKDEKNSPSIKLGQMLENIFASKGSAFIYSEFISFGINEIKDALKQNGYDEYDGSNKKQKSFIILEGGTDSKKRQKLLSIFNSKENMDGSLIKVVIGSKVMKEGISLKNVRSVHIFEPWFNVSRLKQVWGRAIRSCSHVLLPSSERKVDIYLYASTFPTNIKMKKPKSYMLPFTEVRDIMPQNLYAYIQSEEKELRITQVLNVLREIAIDCNLHTKLNNNKKDGVNCEGTIGTVDKSTYDLDKTKLHNALVDFIIKVIKREIRKSYSVSINHLLKLPIVQDEDIDEEVIQYAIYELVPNNQTDYTTYKYFIQIKDQIGYIINKGNYLVFQPLDGENNAKSKREKISMFDRINPSSRKFKNIAFEKNVSQIETEDDINKQKELLQKLKLKEVKIMRDDVIKNNIQAILKTDGELLLLQQSKGKDTIDQRKKSRGRVCRTFNGPDMLQLVKTIGVPKDQYESFFIMKDNKIRVKDKDTLCIIIRDFFYPNINLPSPVSSSVSSIENNNAPKRTRKGERSLAVKEVGNYRFKIVEVDGKQMFKVGNKNVTDRGSKNCSVKRKEDLVEIANEIGAPIGARMSRQQLCDRIQEYVFKPTP